MTTMTTIRKNRQNAFAAPLRRQRRQLPMQAALLLVALFSTASQVKALHISYALTSDTALRVVQTMASVVAAPPNKSKARVFANLKDRRSKEDANGAVNGAINDGAAAVNGGDFVVNGSSHTKNHGQHTAANGVLKVVVPESGVVVEPQTTTTVSSPAITSTLSNLQATDQVELEVNGKKITPKPVTLQAMAWGIPQDTNPKEQVWTALSNLESNSESYIYIYTYMTVLNIINLFVVLVFLRFCCAFGAGFLVELISNEFLIILYFKLLCLIDRSPPPNNNEVEMLDEIAGQKQQLNALEVSLLSGCILAAAAAPIMGGTLTEFIAPSAAACTYFIITMYTLFVVPEPN